MKRKRTGGKKVLAGFLSLSLLVAGFIPGGGARTYADDQISAEQEESADGVSENLQEKPEIAVPAEDNADPKFGAASEVESALPGSKENQKPISDSVEPAADTSKEDTAELQSGETVSSEPVRGSDTLDYTFDVRWANAASSDVKDYHYDEAQDPEHRHLIYTPVDQYLKTATLTYSLAINNDANTVLPVGAVKITVPDYLFETWDDRYQVNYENWKYDPGKTVVWQLPEAPQTSTVSDFHYIDNGDGTRTVTNFKPISGGSKLSFDQAFPFRPHRIYVDALGVQKRNFTVTITLDSDGDGTPDYSQKTDLSAEIHTKTAPMTVDLKADHLSANNGVFFDWQDAWGEKPQDADQYFYVVWFADVQHPRYNTIPYDYEVVQKPGEGELIGVKKTPFRGSVVGFANSLYGLDSNTDTTFSGIYSQDSFAALKQTGLYRVMTNLYCDPSVSVNGFGVADDWNLARFCMLKRYPLSLLQQAKAEGIDLAADGLPITNTVEVVTRRANGTEETREDTEEQKIHVYPYAGVNRIWKYDTYIDETGGGTRIEGSRSFVLNGEDRLLRYKLKDQSFFTHVEGGALSEPIFDETAGEYQAKPYTARITEGGFYDTTGLNWSDYYGKQKAAMTPYEDADITYQSVVFTLNGYNAKKSPLGAWTAQSNPDKTNARFSSVDVYVRKAAGAGYSLYGKLTFDADGTAAFRSEDGSVAVADAKGKEIPLPEGTAGLQYQVHSSYFRYEFFARTLLTMHPTPHVTELLKQHQANGKDSIVSTEAAVTFTEDAGGAPEQSADTGGQVLKQSSLSLADIKPWFGDDKRPDSAISDDSSAGIQDRRVFVQFGQISSLWYTGLPDRDYLKSYVYRKGTLYDLLPSGV